MSIFVIKTKEGDYLDKAGAKVKSIFDAHLISEEKLSTNSKSLCRCGEVLFGWKTVLFSEELKSITL